MTQLSGVTVNVTDGQGGPSAPVIGDTCVFIGCCSANSNGFSRLYGPNQVAQMVSDMGYGPLVQAAARPSSKGCTVAVLKVNATTAGAFNAVTHVGTGSSIVTVSGAALDYYRMIVKVVTGATIGVAGAYLSWSFDNGETDFTTPVAVGTGTTLVMPDTGATLHFASGTLVAGDTFSFTSTPPKWNSADLAAGLLALKGVGFKWDWADVVGAATATEQATVASACDSFAAAGKYVRIMTEAKQQLAENDSTYQADLISDYTTFSHRRILVGAGDIRLFSPIDQSTFLRPATWAMALRACLLNPAEFEIGRTDDDIANSGPLDGSILDPTNQAIGHNEEANPGLDSPAIAGLGFATLRMYQFFSDFGTYCTEGRLMSPQGSTFETFRQGRVMDIACTLTQFRLGKRIQDTPMVTAAGTLDPGYAAALEDAITADVRGQMMDPLKPLVSDFRAVIDLTNQITTTDDINISVSILPLGMIKYITETIGYVSSLSAQAA